MQIVWLIGVVVCAVVAHVAAQRGVGKLLGVRWHGLAPLAGTPRAKRAVIAAVGPLSHYVLAALLAFATYRLSGAPDGSMTIVAVAPGLPAANAGLRPGDRIVAVEGSPEVVSQLPFHVQKGATGLTVSRGVELLRIEVTGEPGPEGKRVIGAPLRRGSAPQASDVAARRALRLPVDVVAELLPPRQGELTGPVAIMAGPPPAPTGEELAEKIVLLGLLLLAYDVWLVATTGRGSASAPPRR